MALPGNSGESGVVEMLLSLNLKKSRQNIRLFYSNSKHCVERFFHLDFKVCLSTKFPLEWVLMCFTCRKLSLQGFETEVFGVFVLVRPLSLIKMQVSSLPIKVVTRAKERVVRRGWHCPARGPNLLNT
jgi:hypothetical protein